MKKILVLTVLMLLVFGTAAMAHPPQNITASFNMENQMLTVEFTHTVGGENSNHYIDQLNIMLNETEVITQIPGKQLKNSESFTYYMPGVTSGDTIEVIAKCSIQGDRSASITVGE